MVHYWYCHYLVPTPVLALQYFGSVSVLAWSITSTGIKWCQYRYWYICTFVQYQYWHGTFPVLPLNGARTGIGILVLGSVSVLARSNTGIGIKWCKYRYWHICTFVQYQYWHGTLLVLPLLGACTGIGILVLWFSFSIGMVHYRYWH
jgi:hypothetical protein